MRKRQLFLMVSLFVLLLGSFVVIEARAATLSWSPVTTYTDNTAIESSKIITYEVQVDGVTQATNVSGISWPIPQGLIGHGKVLTFNVRTKLSTGEVSAWTAPFPWTSPPGVPNRPSGMSVTP
jgi:hypothetical protein